MTTTVARIFRSGLTRVGVGAAGLGIAASALTGCSGHSEPVGPAPHPSSPHSSSQSADPAPPPVSSKPTPTKPVKPPPPPVTNKITEHLKIKSVQLAPGIHRAQYESGTLWTVDLRQPGVGYQLAGLGTSGDLPKTVLEHTKDGVFSTNLAFFDLPGDSYMPRSAGYKGVEGQARSMGVDWPSKYEFPRKNKPMLVLDQHGAHLVRDDFKNPPKSAITVATGNDLLWTHGKYRGAKAVGDPGTVGYNAGRTVGGASQDGSHLYFFITDANHTMTSAKAAQRMVNMVHALKMPALDFVIGWDGGGSSSGADIKGVNDTLGRGLTSVGIATYSKALANKGKATYWIGNG